MGELVNLEIDESNGAFVYAMHVGMLVAVGFMILASVVSALFVRSHVEGEGPPEEASGGH